MKVNFGLPILLLSFILAQSYSADLVENGKTYTFKNVGEDPDLLDITGPNDEAASSQGLTTAPPTSNKDQQFQVTKLANGNYQLKTRGGEGTKCLQAKNPLPSSSSQSDITEETCQSSNKQQQWIFSAAEGSSGVGAVRIKNCYHSKYMDANRYRDSSTTQNFVDLKSKIKNCPWQFWIPIKQADAPVCGNGKVEEGEECDDGNTTNGDGCSSDCQNETPAPVCGNGTVEEGEECDDGNTTNGDGCSSDCKTETPAPVCGNGTVEEGEECDDGNTTSGDGCSSACRTEDGDCILNGNPCGVDSDCCSDYCDVIDNGDYICQDRI